MEKISRLKAFIAMLFAVAFIMATTQRIFAEDKKMEINTSFSIKQILDSAKGQRVSLKTDAGEALEGTVTSVGDHLVHISKLSGRDFYDAVVVIDKISAVVFRARGN